MGFDAMKLLFFVPKIKIGNILASFIIIIFFFLVEILVLRS
jgi:hypothetical protein